MKYERKSIGELCTKLTDGSHYSPKESEVGFPMASSKDMAENDFDLTNLKTIPESDYHKLVKADCKPLKDDILIIKDGNSYLKYIFRVKEERELVVLSSIAILRPNKDLIEPIFFQYLLRSPIVKDGMKNYISGSAIPRIVLKDFKAMVVELPPLLTQRRIAAILSAYDDLIENNGKRIKLLEEKAYIEYKSVLKSEKIQFRKAVDVLHFTTGKLNSNAAVERGVFPFFTCGQEVLKTNTFSFDEEVVLLGGNNANAIYPVFYFNGKFDAYQRTYIIRPKSELCISIKYLYFFWESKLDYLRNISTGAATKFLTLKILNDINVPVPPKKVMEEYEELTEPIFKLKAILSEQNAKLREARDILLPRLMSGELVV